jgi:hypothetical protein
VFVVDMLFAVLMAVVFTAIFVVGLRRTGPWSSVVAFFLVIFLAAWAGGLWVSPAGPVFVGVYWLPIILVALLVGLLLAAVPPQPPRRVETISRAQGEAQQERAVRRAFDAFFWTLVIAFSALIVLGYVVGSQPV